MISYDDFAKLEIKIGKIIACEKVENADKLLKLTVDFGMRKNSENTQSQEDSGHLPAMQALQAEAGMTENQGNSSTSSESNSSLSEQSESKGREIRIIVSGIAEWYKPEDLVGKLCPFLVNLEPRKLRGIESQGMILAADPGGSAVLLHPDKEIPEGSIVK